MSYFLYSDRIKCCLATVFVHANDVYSVVLFGTVLVLNAAWHRYVMKCGVCDCKGCGKLCDDEGVRTLDPLLGLKL